MGMVKANKSTKNLISTAWRLCKFKKAGQVTPAGCFSVYVGPEKQRFVLKAEYVNHPLFKVLLEDAALEYGYRNDGPLLLPCEVDLFYNVLAEMESTDDDIDEEMMISSNRSLIQFFFSPTRGYHSNSRMNKDYGGGYRPLNMNKF